MADIVISLDWGQASLLLIGTGISIATVGKWFLDRTNKGLDAYTEQRMRNLATKQDIHIAVETITATEQAKSAVAGRAWNSQQMWSSKRDVYVGLIELLTDMKNHLIKQRRCVLMLQAPNVTIDTVQEMQPLLASSEREMLDVTTRYSRLNTTAILFISVDSLKILSEIEIKDTDWRMRDWQQTIEINVDSIENGLVRLAKAASVDLAYDPEGRVAEVRSAGK
jgi:hypothetical protein